MPTPTRSDTHDADLSRAAAPAIHPAVVAVCAYLVGLPTAFQPDVPLIALSLLAALTTLSGRRWSRPALTSPLALATFAFVVAAVVSTALADDVWRSIRLSAPLLPAVLLFVLIAGYFRTDRDVRAVYGAWSLAATAVATTVLVLAWRGGPRDATAFVAALESPLLVVPNDCLFLAVAAPLSAALLATGSAPVRTLAAVSLVTSAAAVAVLQSRIAAGAMLLGLAAAAVAERRRRARAWLAAALAVAVLADGARGFPLAAKFAASSLWNSRLALWLSAWAMFRDAPLFGHGPRSYGILYRSYLERFQLPAWLPVDDRIAPWPHNLFLELLAEQGIVGFAIFMLMFGIALVGAWRLRTASAPDTRSLAAFAFGSFCAFAIAAAGELSFLRHWVAVYWWTMSGVIAHLSSTRHPKGEP